MRGTIILEGFWQDENYFKSIRETLLDDFTFRDEGTFEQHDLARQVTTTESVCIHVRRTDYLLPQRSGLRVLEVDYYKSAVEAMASRVRNAHFYIFSDDIEWSIANLTFFKNDHTFIKHAVQSERAAFDLYLMTRCKHFIIANSTYSWWGAWLARHAGKQVIAPQRWFGKVGPPETPIPSNWIAF